MSGQQEPPQQARVPQNPPSPPVNSTVALVILGLVTAGIMLGYLLGRATNEQKEPLIAQQLTITPAPTNPPVLDPDVSPQELQPVAYSQRFTIEIPEPQNCRDCIESTDTFLQVVSRGEPISDTGDVVPSLEDWRFTVQELTEEATEAAGIPAAVFEDIEQRSLVPVSFTHTESGETGELTLNSTTPVIIDDLVFPYFVTETNSFGSGYQQVLIMDAGDSRYFFSFEFISESYDGVFQEAVESFRLKNQNTDTPEASESATASGPARIINQEEPEFLLQ